MTKELIICIIIVVLIFVGNVITQKYTEDSITEASESLNSLREELIKEETVIDSEYSNNKVKDIRQAWDKRHEKLAYYIEHDELEKIETDLSGLKGYIEAGEYKEAVAELDRTVYVLQHIKNKNVFSLENIF